ncbi:sterol desaturase family protein [Synechocystis salina LEGE 06099]|uniref:sterol desaturase family protein n=1 Tax=Synechocystis salina TaxID=945780 RepID=UPI00187DFCD1|nr:sterol desaturase family protein [Synechocystis salina]MBE9204605.1 sterol desaturase family protein [Synechocystis salina LEGE 06099]
MDYSFGIYGLIFFVIILLRYFLIAGGTYAFFYSPWGQSLISSQFPINIPPWSSIRKDIKLSVISAMVFAVAAAFIFSSYGWKINRLYFDPYQHGLWYLGVSYILVLLLQDTYFYFTHRLFHHHLLFPLFHQGHHCSRYPTPLTSFAFDLPEAIVQSFFLIVVVSLIPLHFFTLLAILITMTIWSVINHLGIDRLPLTFPHHWLGKYFIGTAHHSLHHLKHNANYGLYFTFWDKILGTEDPTYQEKLGRNQATKEH